MKVLYGVACVAGVALMCFAIRLDQMPGLPLALVGIGVVWVSFWGLVMPRGIHG